MHCNQKLKLLNLCIFLFLFLHSYAQLDSLKHILVNTDSNIEKLDILKLLIEEYKLEECDSVFYYSNQFLDIPAHRDSKWVLDVIATRINCLVNTVNGETILKEVEKIEKLKTPNIDTVRKNLLIWRFKYIAYSTMDSIQLSLNALDKELQYALKSENPRHIMRAYSGLADTYAYYFGESGLEISLEYCKKSFRIIESLIQKDSSATDIINSIAFRYNLATTFHELGKIDSAAYYYKISLELQEAHPELITYSWGALIKSNYSNLLMLQGRKEEALEYSEEALSEIEEVKNDYSQILILIEVAKIYKELGFNIKALPLIARIKKDHHHFNDKTLNEKVYKFLADTERDSNPKQALVYMERYLSARDSIQKDANVLNIARIEANFQFENDRQQLVFKQSLKETKIEQQRYLLILSVFLVILMSIIIFLVYQNNKFQRAINKQLIETQKHLQQSNRRLSRFARSVSHDVIGKLEYILLAGNRVKESEFSTPPTREYFNRSISSATWLKNYCRDLLLWSDKEPTKTVQSPKTEIQEIVDAILRDYDNLLEEHGFEVSVGDLPIVNMEVAPLQQVLQNLIDNAIKYSLHQANPKIRIAAVLEDGDWILMIKDNGKGIEETEKSTIFEDTTDVSRAHGRGLYFVRELLLEHEETIWLDSNEWGGSSFYFTIR